MTLLDSLYRPPLTLLTDLYELTMAYGFWKSGLANREAVFHLSFRKNPFHGGFAIACGLSYVVDFLASFRFSADDLAYLSGLRGTDERPLFPAVFLEYLGQLMFACDVDGVPEGSIVFAREPLLRVSGPIIQAQLLETLVSNLINFQTLIATKAARICMAAAGDPVIEFGPRRAQGIDGAMAASRAAFIGGCTSTSNVLAGKMFGIPVAGTHAHSWVMAFDDELTAFDAYAAAMPNNCVFLVDTYSTLTGVRHAIEVGRQMRSAGHEMIGVRLDSGDLAYFSREARKLLDEAGFPNAAIVASNELDEHLITALKHEGAAINVWGVGGRLVTAADQPALGAVYKLSAIRSPGGPWQHRIKLSEQTIKVSDPGVLQVRRFIRDGEYAGDMIYNEAAGPPTTSTLVDPQDANRQKRLPPGTPFEELLIPVFRTGRQVYEPSQPAAARERTLQELTRLSPSVKRLVNPHEYPVGLEPSLFEMKNRLIRKARGLEP
jgi:nicotinate phosphoribosyltransferase